MQCAPEAELPQLLKAHWIGCAEDTWSQIAAKKLAPREPVMINVGANKGYIAAAFLRLFALANTTPGRWGDAIQKYAHDNNLGYLKYQPCGACFDCREKRTKEAHDKRGGHVHLLELLPKTRALLRHLVHAFDADDAVTVHDLAASNETKTVPAPDALYLNYAGTEYASLQNTPLAHRQRRAQPQLSLNLTTVDDLMDSHKLDRVYQVTIDAEGWDGLVLEGMRRALRAKRVDLVEFEYNAASWRRSSSQLRHPRTLGGTVAWLRALGYTCHMLAGAHGTWPISGECWRESMDEQGWANVLCAHSPAALALLQAHNSRPGRGASATL